jgi:hypothetical protein
VIAIVRQLRFLMPWELTIRALNNEPLRDRDTVVKLITAAVPAIRWIEEPPLLERIKDMPNHPYHALIPTGPEERRARFAQSKLLGDIEAPDFSVQLYGFEAKPIPSVCVEVRGNGNSWPFLAAIYRPNGRFATDDSDGRPVDLDAESAKGWESFCDCRDGVIRTVQNSTEG